MHCTVRRGEVMDVNLDGIRGGIWRKREEEKEEQRFRKSGIVLSYTLCLREEETKGFEENATH